MDLTRNQNIIFICVEVLTFREFTCLPKYLFIQRVWYVRCVEVLKFYMWKNVTFPPDIYLVVFFLNRVVHSFVDGSFVSFGTFPFLLFKCQFIVFKGADLLFLLIVRRGHFVGWWKGSEPGVWRGGGILSIFGLNRYIYNILFGCHKYLFVWLDHCFPL